MCSLFLVSEHSSAYQTTSPFPPLISSTYQTNFHSHLSFQGISDQLSFPLLIPVHIRSTFIPTSHSSAYQTNSHSSAYQTTSHSHLSFQCISDQLSFQCISDQLSFQCIPDHLSFLFFSSPRCCPENTHCCDDGVTCCPIGTTCVPGGGCEAADGNILAAFSKVPEARVRHLRLTIIEICSHQ